MTRPNYMDLVKETRLGSIISPKDIIANQITRYVRALANSQDSAVESLYKMLGGQIEALEFTAGAGSAPLLGRKLKDLKLRKGVAARGHCAAGLRHHHPGGMTEIQKGDHVVVVARAMGLKNLTDILE